MSNNLNSAIQAACNGLRGDYARQVVKGNRRWSGADLAGKAKEYGGSYARQRAKASIALRRVGGLIVPIDHGRLVTAVIVGMDDFGAAIYATTEGLAVQYTAKTARLV